MPPVQLSESQVQAIGETLKAAREKRGDNIAEAAFRIALSPSQLRAMESGDLRPFYGPSYFLQAAQRYANLLGVELPAPPPVPEPPPPPEEHTEATPAHTPTPAAAVPAAKAPDRASASATPIPQAAENIAASEDTMDAAPEPQAAQRASGGLRWGWIALAAAALITLGILKISLEQPPRQEASIAQAPSSATPATESAKPTEATNATTAPTPPPQSAASNTAPAGPAAAPAPASGTTAALAPPATLASGPRLSQPSLASDSQLMVQTSTWVQIVKNNGEKINLKAEPGQRVEFAAADTAAIVFGQPDKASLSVQGKPVNLAPFITQDSPPRALVILNRINL